MKVAVHRERGIPYYAGLVHQRGHGIGSLFRGLCRFAMPFIKQGAKAVGLQTLQTGIQVAEDVSENRPVKESVKARMREAGTALKTKAETKLGQLLTGNCRRRAFKRGARRHIGSPVKRRKRTNNRTRDIFS